MKKRNSFRFFFRITKKKIFYFSFKTFDHNYNWKTAVFLDTRKISICSKTHLRRCIRLIISRLWIYFFYSPFLPTYSTEFHHFVSEKKKKMTKLFARIWINNHDNGKENKRYYYAYDTRFFQSARDETTVIRQVFFYIFLRYIFLLQKFLYLYEILWLIKKIRIIRNNIFLYIRIT